MSATCKKCSANCIFKEPKTAGEVFGFPCDFCRKVLCKGCTGISSTEIRCLILSTRTMPYLCTDCVPGIKNALSLNNRVSALENALSEVKIASSQRIEELDKQIRDINDEVRSINTSLQTILEDIKMDLKDIKETTSKPPLNTNVNVLPGYSAAVVQGRVFQEVSERQKRSCNLMIFNFAQDSEENDLSKAKNFLTDLIGSPIKVISAVRIGKSNKNGHQSLRLTLESAEIVLKALRRKREIDRSKKIFLEADLTTEQRIELNALKKELKERQRNGESNLILKYVNGVPKLVTKN